MSAIISGTFIGSISGSNAISLGFLEFSLIAGRLAVRTIDGSSLPMYFAAYDDPTLLGGTFAGSQTITSASPQTILPLVQRNKITLGGGMDLQISMNSGKWYNVNLAITSTNANPNANVLIKYSE